MWNVAWYSGVDLSQDPLRALARHTASGLPPGSPLHENIGRHAQGINGYNMSCRPLFLDSKERSEQTL
jgi:hypothetical protein